MKTFFNTIIKLNLFMLLSLTSCGTTSQNNSHTFTVLASTSVLGDIAQNVAGDHVQVHFLLPIGSDPHAYQAVPSDVAKIAESDVLILNGLDYEHFIEPVLDAQSAGGERIIIEATTGLTPLEEHADETESDEGHEGEAFDPHLWLDPNLVVTYVENIRDGLIQADPANTEAYTINAEVYIAELQALDVWIVEQVNQIPAERKLLVTNHEALTYFANRYGFEITGTILPSMSTNASPSAQQMAQLIDEIKASGASAIFLGEVENTILAEQIAEETGVMIVDDLHLESLTVGEPANNYINMMKHNVNRIVNALK